MIMIAIFPQTLMNVIGEWVAAWGTAYMTGDFWPAVPTAVYRSLWGSAAFA
jgi:hypothetical protein